MNSNLMHSLYLISFLIVLQPASIFTQVFSELDYLKLNSYLIKADYSAVENFFEEEDLLFTDKKIDPDDRKTYQDIKDRYHYLTGYFNKIDSLSVQECDKRISQYLLFEEYF